MKYAYTLSVPYQEVDTTRRWRLYNLENALLQTAADVANGLGFGIRQLFPYGYTWILTRMDIEMRERPMHGDVVTIQTWIERNAHLLSTRNFRIYKGDSTDGGLIGRVSSVWAVLDLQSRQVVNAFDLPMFDGCVDGEPLVLPRQQRVMPLRDVEEAYRSRVTYSDMDYNGHCNSCKYLEHMLDVHRPAFLDNPVPFRLTVQYSREIREGDTYAVKYADTGDACQWQMLNASGETSASARLTNLNQIDYEMS
ncbi:MAG: hypothetical protein J6Y00_06830 [Paludibacteraceae bacterium]|nr:hypothetical protein [Paludibacteraceae bacterium]